MCWSYYSVMSCVSQELSILLFYFLCNVIDNLIGHTEFLEEFN